MAGIELARSPPDPDDEIHGNQHDLPEDVKEEKVEGHENTQHAYLENQEVAVILPKPLCNRRPGRQDGDEAHQCGQENQQQADAINPEVELGTDGIDPVRANDESHPGRLDVQRIVELRYQGKRDQKTEKGDDVGNPLDGVVTSLSSWPQYDQHHPNKREEAHNVEDVLHKEIHRLNSQIEVQADDENESHHKSQGVSLKQAGLQPTDYCTQK